MHKSVRVELYENYFEIKKRNKSTK
jgi:hypothetical protein